MAMRIVPVRVLMGNHKIDSCEKYGRRRGSEMVAELLVANEALVRYIRVAA